VGAGDLEFSWSLRPNQDESRGVRRFRSGIVALANGQTARVHVVNAASEPTSRAKTVCWGLWSNPNSELLGEGTFGLAAGASAFRDSPDRPAGGQGERAQIRAMVAVLDDWEADCVVTLEVFESKSQRAAVLMLLAEERRGLAEQRDLMPASALLPAGRSPGAAEPERLKGAAELDVVLVRPKRDWRQGVRRFRSGIVGVARGQTAWVHVVNTTSEPDAAAKTAWIQGWSSNPRSEPLTEGTALRLPSGASVFHDFRPDASAVGQESRAQVRVSVIVLDDPRAECVVTVEVFDDDSGRTAVIVQIPDDP